MIAQGLDVSVTEQATTLVDIPGVVFRAFRNEPDLVPFSTI